MHLQFANEALSFMKSLEFFGVFGGYFWGLFWVWVFSGGVVWFWHFFHLIRNVVWVFMRNFEKCGFGFHEKF